jgi:hypothetical protein
MREMVSCDLETENQLSAPLPACAELSMVDHWFHEKIRKSGGFWFFMIGFYGPE